MSRLIDADAINPMRCPRSIAEMRGWIDELPTAYDIDKVIEQLEKVSFVDVDEEYADDGQRMLFLHDAIEIVKGGVE